MAYEHTQSGWPVRITFGATALAFLVMGSVRPLSGPTPSAVSYAGAILALALGLLWSRLTIRVDRDRLRWDFGPGWPRFSLPLADIERVEVARTTFWQGWGIHRTRGGWLYNIAGRDAVRILRKDGKQLLLGTDEPSRLKVAIERGLAARR
jgi:hypothetical protein